MNSKLMKIAFNSFPPYWGTGISVKKISRNYRHIDVEMRLRWFNRNVKGTHFGGNLFSMTDPFYMIMLIQVLGKGYDVWDQRSEIKFCRPGKGTVKAHFELSDQKISRIVDSAQNKARTTADFTTEILDEAGLVVAIVTKTIYIRKRNPPSMSEEKVHDIAA